MSPSHIWGEEPLSDGVLHGMGDIVHQWWQLCYHPPLSTTWGPSWRLEVYRFSSSQWLRCCCSGRPFQRKWPQWCQRSRVSSADGVCSAWVLWVQSSLLFRRTPRSLQESTPSVHSLDLHWCFWGVTAPAEIHHVCWSGGGATSPQSPESVLCNPCCRRWWWRRQITSADDNWQNWSFLHFWSPTAWVSSSSDLSGVSRLMFFCCSLQTSPCSCSSLSYLLSAPSAQSPASPCFQTFQSPIQTCDSSTSPLNVRRHTTAHSPHPLLLENRCWCCPQTVWGGHKQDQCSKSIW